MKKFDFDIIGTRKYWYILSTLLILPGIISLFVWKLNVGIDFKGGALQQVEFSKERPNIDQLRTEASNAHISGVNLQTTGEKGVIIRFPNENNQKPREAGTAIFSKIQQAYPDAQEVSFESIGGSVAQSTTNKAIWSVIITSLAIILFIAWSFASVPRPASSWRFGVTAILALAHDILFVTGAFSIIGHFFPSIEVDSLFITALLTILGFSVNDTIVVFDRIRENLRRAGGRSFAEIANSSLNQTLARSLNTSMTVLVVLLALLLIGGSSIRNFILALTLGVAIGTYSSIFNASPLLVSWQGMAERAVEPIKKKK
jgi:preprotein translocase subunit SecF